jgi:hypothetical protein
VTTTYKVPMSYILKRRVVQSELPYADLRNMAYLLSAYRAMLSEEVPEYFLKFYMRNLLTLHYEAMDAVTKSLLIGVISTLILSPLELYKTTVLCKGIDIKYNFKALLLRITNAILNTFLFFFCMEKLLSFQSIMKI